MVSPWLLFIIFSVMTMPGPCLCDVAAELEATVAFDDNDDDDSETVNGDTVECLNLLLTFCSFR